MKRVLLIWIVFALLFSNFLVITINTKAESTSIDIPLYSGTLGNLITIPVEIDMTASDLAEMIPGCERIFRYNGTSSLSGYCHYIVGDPSSPDCQIEGGFPMRITVGNDTTLTVSGELLSNLDVELQEGWNMLGWCDSVSTTASEVMSSIVGCTRVLRTDSLNQKSLSYTGSSDPDFTIGQCDGYYVNIEILDSLTIFAPSSVNEGESFQVTVTSEGSPIENAEVTFAGSNYVTDASGQTSLTAPSVSEDTEYTITTSKADYISDETQITVVAEVVSLPELTIYSDSAVEEENTFTVTVKSNNVGVEGVLLSFLEDQYYTDMNGQVSLTSPSVNADTYYTISASKNGYNPDSFQIEVQNVEVVFGQLDITNPTSVSEKESFAVDVTYLGNSIENAQVTFLGSMYYTDSNGQVTLIAPSVNKDTTYTISAQKAGYESIEKTIVVRTTILSNGVIYGSCLKDAKICVYYSESGVTKTKCTYCDSNGNYNLLVNPDSYNLIASKSGYKNNLIEDIEVSEAEQVNVDVTLEKSTEEEGIGSFADYTIEEEVKKGKISGKVDPKNKIVTMYGNVSIELTPDTTLSDEGIEIVVSGEGEPGTKIVVYLGQLEDPNSLIVKYDGEIINRTMNVLSFFNDSNNRSEWILTLVEENGHAEYILIINIPHFSEHTITILSTFVEEVVEKTMEYKEIVIAGAIAVIAIAGLAMFRKGKEEY